MTTRRKLAVVLACGAFALSGCGFTPYDLPLPGGADVGSDPYDVTIEFADALDLVPQSGVRVNDLPVGRVTTIELSDDGWNALVTVRINGDVELPANAVATIRQTSILGEKFVSIDPPPTNAAGRLEDGAHIPLEQSGRNPEIEEVLAAASLLLNGGGLERTRTIVQELNATLGGRTDEIKSVITEADTFLGQLDDNSDTIVDTLEKVNALSQTVNDRTDTIEAALRDLPDALRVLDDQRENIVAMLESLNELSDVATDVITESKDDVVANLENLAPIVRDLAATGDELTTALDGFVSFPFTKGAVGGSLQAAKDTRYGDFANLSVRLELTQENLEQLFGVDLGVLNVLDLSDAAGALEGVFGEAGADLGGLGSGAGIPNMETVPGVEGLLELNEGIIPRTATPQDDPATPPQRGTSAERSGNDLCTLLLNLCRPATGGQ